MSLQIIASGVFLARVYNPGALGLEAFTLWCDLGALLLDALYAVPIAGIVVIALVHCCKEGATARGDLAIGVANEQNEPEKH